MSSRPLPERVAEIRKKREQVKKKLDQYDAQVKRLEKLAADEERKQRTHKLIVCGAEIAALFEHVLEKDEVLILVNYLREQKQLGYFSLGNPKAELFDDDQDTTTEEKSCNHALEQSMFNF